MEVAHGKLGADPSANQTEGTAEVTHLSGFYRIIT